MKTRMRFGKFRQSSVKYSCKHNNVGKATTQESVFVFFFHVEIYENVSLDSPFSGLNQFSQVTFSNVNKFAVLNLAQVMIL